MGINLPTSLNWQLVFSPAVLNEPSRVSQLFKLKGMVQGQKPLPLTQTPQVLSTTYDIPFFLSFI